MKKLFIIISLLLVSSFVFSQQKLKLGYVDSNELIKIMPGKDSAQAKYDEYAKMVESQYKKMQAEFETLYQDYLANEKTYTELIKSTKQKELQDMQERIKSFEMSAQQDMQSKQQELLKPIIEKAKKAIEEVAKENGFTYIFDVGSGSLLFYEAGENIMPIVKKKLNLK